MLIKTRIYTSVPDTKVGLPLCPLHFAVQVDLNIYPTYSPPLSAP